LGRWVSLCASKYVCLWKPVLLLLLLLLLLSSATCRYRFLQRETRWKGLEDSLDECIEEGMRTLDQMCFSSQCVQPLDAPSL
jgi:hypothetical protein